jgi:hypothetical protein
VGWQRPDSRKQKVPGGCPALNVESGISLVVIVVVIMIVIIPIVIRTPAVAVLIPPAMAVFPAPGTCFSKLMAILRGLRAVPTVMLGGLMELVIRVGDALLTIVVISAQRGGAHEEKRSA